MLDDVDLVLRGLNDVDVDETHVRLLWVISHPDLLTAQEMARYDHVLAASTSWAQAVTKERGIVVEPLLQCTDSQLFTPDAAPADTGAPVLFVGNSRGVYRPAVRCAVEAGVDLRVYGGGWEAFLPESCLGGAGISQAELPAAYASAGIVLNDHWNDMRLEGFVSNRVFDVLAVGGRLATDAVEGLDEVLLDGKDVVTWHGPDELVTVLQSDPNEVFPDRTSRLTLADHVRREHSFDARARRLLDIALESRE
jgi:hypothetical protein